MTKNSKFTFILFSACLTTLYFNPDLQDPFNSPKMWIVCVSSFWLLGEILTNLRNNKFHDKNFKISSYPAILFTFFLFLSALVTDVKYTAIFGETQRRIGFLTYFSFMVFFLVTQLVFTQRDLNRLIIAANIVSIFLIIYGFMQTTGNDFIEWNNPYNSIIGTLGNPNYVSALYAILSVLSLSFAFDSSKRISVRVFNICLIFSMIYLIYSSDSRQGLVAFAIGSLVFLFFFVYYKNIRFGILTGLTVISLFLIGIFGMLQKGPLAEILYKPSVSVRGFYWRAGIEMLKNNPIFGVGVDRYGAYFKEYREIKYPINYGFDITSTNAHNVPIQIFATCGLITGILYVIFILSVFFLGFKNLIKTNSKNSSLKVGVFAAWVAYVAQSIISIDNIGLTIWGWVLAGAIVALSRDNAEVGNNKTSLSRKISSIKTYQPAISGLLTLISILLVSILYRGESLMMETRARFNGLNQNNSDLVYKFADKTFRQSLIEPNYKLIIAQLTAQSGNISKADSLASELLISDPRNQDYLIFASYLAESKGEYSRAISLRKSLRKVDPFNANNELELAKLLVRENQASEASKLFQDIIKNYENTKEASLAFTELAKLN